MRTVFADAGYWIALFNPRDRLHIRAIKVSQAKRGCPIITSQMALTEFLNHYAAMGEIFRQQAVQVVRSLEKNRGVEIVKQTEDQFTAALALYEQRPDKGWGLTDCASFLIMQERGITEALAYDDHFRQAGFIALLRED